MTGRVRVLVTSSAPIQTIPAGTRLRLKLEATGETVDFFTDEMAQIITTETLEAIIPVSAEYLGVRGGRTPEVTRLDVVDPLTFIESVTVSETLTTGSGQEADAPFYARASATLARLTSTLVLPEHFQYAAPTRVGVGRAKVYDLYNLDTPETTAPGHITIAVADANGQPLETDAKTGLGSWLAEQSLASLAIHAIDPTYTTVDLTVSVLATPGSDHAQVEASVTNALT